ncbi:dihydrofolate reductase [uncultured Clostridium sp.]|uniref:dihydrofolate reductase n=1 Tax=uncultured Clostridium sp. TaxID=59620 RepID=UPI0028F0F910|nr:dihydrofolate reductase [uncultured Clostridium sp.]
MILVFSVDNNWNIGYKGDLLYKISEDLKRFRKLTENNIVIMGRRTFESLPDKKALPNRINIVITENKEYKGRKGDNIIIVNSIEELLSVLKEVNPNNAMENFVIGGGNIARQIMPYCTKAYITKILKSFEKADTSMPNLDLLDDWKIVKESEIYKQEDVEYKYVDYVKVT